MSKPRSDAKLLNLPEEQQGQLAEWLLNGISYHKALALLKKEFGVSSSTRALSDFFDAVCAPALSSRRRQWVRACSQVERDIEENPANWDAVLMEQAKELAARAMSRPQPDPSEVAALLSLVLKASDQKIRREAVELSRRRLELLEKRESDARGVLCDAALSPEEKEARIRAVFGMT